MHRIRGASRRQYCLVVDRGINDEGPRQVVLSQFKPYRVFTFQTIAAVDLFLLTANQLVDERNSLPKSHTRC